MKKTMTSKPGSGRGFRFLSLNLWNYNEPWEPRRELIVELLQREQPDVVALQEVRNDFHRNRRRGDQSRQIATLMKWQLVYQPAMVYFPLPRVEEGLALLSPHRLTNPIHVQLSRKVLDKQDLHQRIVLGAEVQREEDSLLVFCTHLSLSATARHRTIAEAAAFVTTTAGKRPALLVGDFNARPDSLPVRFITGQAEIGGERGDFVDLWDVAGDGQGNTYPSHEPKIRIDYAFLRAPGRKVNTLVRWIRTVGDEPTDDGLLPSDHLALVGEMVLS